MAAGKWQTSLNSKGPEMCGQWQAREKILTVESVTKHVAGTQGLLPVKARDVKGKRAVNGRDVTVDGMGC